MLRISNKIPQRSNNNGLVMSKGSITKMKKRQQEIYKNVQTYTLQALNM